MRWVDPLLGPVTAPDAKLVAVYETAFGNYKAAREAMRPIWKAMAATSENATDAT